MFNSPIAVGDVPPTTNTSRTFEDYLFEDLGLFNEDDGAQLLDWFSDVFNDAANVAGNEVILESNCFSATEDLPQQSPLQCQPAATNDVHKISTVVRAPPRLSLASSIPMIGSSDFFTPLPTNVASVEARTLTSQPVTMDKNAYRKQAIARWQAKRKRRVFGAKTHRFPEYECRRRVASRRPRVNGRFIREQPVYVSLSELQQRQQS